MTRVTRQNPAATLLDTSRDAPRLFIVLDDQLVSHNTAIAEAEKRGQRLNLAISANLVNGEIESRPEHMSWLQIRTAAMRGHGIMSHSVTHLSLAVEGREVAQVVTDLEDSRALIESKIGAPVRTFVYPNSSRDAFTDSAAYLRYDRIFGGNFGGLSYRQKFWYRHPFVHGRFGGWSSANHNEVKNQINQAAAADEDIVIYTHATDGSDFLTAGVTAAQFNEVLDLALKLRMRVVSVDEMGYDDYLTDPGFEDADNFSDNFDVTVTSWGANASASIVTLATAEGLPGSKVLKLSNTQNTTGSVVVTQKKLIPTTVFTQPPGEVFASARIKCDRDAGDGGAGIRLILADIDGNLASGAGGTLQSSTLYSTNSWSGAGQTYTDSNGLVVNNKEPWPYFTIQYRIVNMTGDAWFDAARIGQTLLEIGVSGS